MGACLSCLGLKSESNEAERSRLLYDDPYNQPSHNNYGSWSQGTAPPQNFMSVEEVQREQRALDSITRWASDQIVEIFPHQHRNLAASTSQLNGFASSDNALNASAHQDVLLSMIPGDKSKRSIRIYPASRPTSSSKDTSSLRSKSSTIRGGNDGSRGKGSGVFVTLNVDMP